MNIEPEQIIENIGWNIERYGKIIFNNFSNDWIDLLLFISTYNIQIGTKTMEFIYDNIDYRENPVNLAAVLINYTKKNKLKKKQSEDLDKLIREKIKLINWTCFFEDPNSWWIIIFYGYPQLKQETKNILSNKLKKVVCISEDEEVLYSDGDSTILLVKKFLIKYIH
ncbi:hypothetical protein PGC35_07585 [Psychrobacillus sp. PGGUH221]|uniref:hypothetical protein n=1 Tax=Psychrobacillus sp. PGGUH221 TaxID=3020058 RepID=UPI0035C6DC69